MWRRGLHRHLQGHVIAVEAQDDGHGKRDGPAQVDAGHRGWPVCGHICNILSPPPPSGQAFGEIRGDEGGLRDLRDLRALSKCEAACA